MKIAVHLLFAVAAAIVSMIAVTIMSISLLQQLAGIFYAATINAAIITAIIIIAVKWLHVKYESVS